MGHDIHFLSRLSRVSDADVDLAMSLYRDVSTVRELVSAADLPPEAQRVAIALDASPSPPLVLVERDGRFVTCLAAGMKADLPIISRAALDRHLRQKERIEKVMASLDELGPARSAFERLYLDAETLERETFLPLLVTSELLESRYTEHIVDRLKPFIIELELLAGRSQVRTRDEPLLERVWQNGWVVAHLTLFVARSLRERAASEPDTARWLATLLLNVGAHGYLHDAARAPEHRSRGKAPAPVPEGSPWYASRGGECPARPRRPRALPRQARGGDPQDPRAARRRQGSAGGRGPGRAGPLSPQRPAGVMGVHVTEHLAEGDPARWNVPEEVPPELTLPLLGQFAATQARSWIWEISLGALPLVARASPEDFYVPAALRRRWARLDPRSEVGRVVEEMRPLLASATVRAEPAPGRNDPCRCGSGRKFKKCCGR